MNTGVNVSLNYGFLWICAWSWIVKSYVSSIYFSKEPLYLFSKVAMPIYITTSGIKGSLFSTSSPEFNLHRLFNDGHSEWWELTPHCVVLIYISLIVIRDRVTDVENKYDY